MALSANRSTSRSLGDLLAVPVAAGAHVYAGSMVCVNASGYAVAAADSAGLKFMGVATEEADNSAGADGAISVVVQRRGRFRFEFGGGGALDQSGIAGAAYVVDDETVGAANNTVNDVLVGQIARVISSGQCEVDIDAAVRQGAVYATATTTTTTAAA